MSLQFTQQIRSLCTRYETILIKWLSSAKLRVKPSTFARYQYVCKKYIQPYLGNIPLSKLTYQTLENYIDYLLHYGSCTGEGLSSKTVADIYSVIKLTLDFAGSMNYAINAGYRLVTIRKQYSQTKVLSKQQQNLITAAASKNTAPADLGILFSLYMGLRLGEVCALKWKHISFSEQTLTVRHTVQRIPVSENSNTPKTGIIITEPKSQSSIRIIPMPEFLIHLAKPLYRNPECYILTGTDRCMEPRTLQNYFHRVQKKCRIAPVNYHILRHTFATRCIELGFDIKTLSEILGHATVSITLNRYVHSSLDLKKQYMEKINQ